MTLMAGWCTAAIMGSLPCLWHGWPGLIPGANRSSGAEPPAGLDGSPATGSAAGNQKSSSREVRRFDFEEIDQQPVSFPVDFYRLGNGPDAAGVEAGVVRPGFPPFGWMGFADDSAHSGRWSLKFALEGGSMGAVLAPRSAPIIPGGDYLVTAWVRTEGLHHARGRVEAVLYDQNRQPLANSRVRSEPIDTRGAWTQVTLRIPAHRPEAASLVVELLLLQPGQWSSHQPERFEPVLEDVAGSIWFDDVAIWHVPRFDVRTNSEPGHGNLIVPPDAPGLVIHVSDLASEPLTVSVTVVNLADEVVHREAFEVASGRTDRRIDLPGLSYGWYRASIDLNTSRDWLGADSVNFAYLPPPVGRSRSAGLALDDETTRDAVASARIAAALGSTPVILPAWDARHTSRHTRTAFEPLRQAAERITHAGGDVIFSLPLVPNELAEALGLRRDDVLGVFTGDATETQPALERLLFVLGQRVDQWQIGATGDRSTVWRDDLGSIHETVRAALARLVPGPIVVHPWSIEFPLQSTARSGAFTLLIPWRTPPHAIGDLLATWPSDAEWTLVIEPLPDRVFTNHDRVTDLTLRVLHARRAGATRMVIARPWMRPGDSEEPMPQPWLPAWIELGRELEGRAFAGEVPMGRGLTCWLFDGPPGPVLAVWNRDAIGDDVALSEQLAAGPVTLIDAMGNRRNVPLTHGVHRVPLSDRPVLITGVDSGLAKFRQKFSLMPASAPSMQREHHHELVLANPWATTISGTIRIVEPEHWRFTPTRIPFSIAAGAEARLPFSLSFGPNELAGEKRIEAEVELNSGQRSTFRVSAPFELGTAGLVLEPLWRVTGDSDGEASDVLITVHITNTGADPISLESFVRAPGYPRLSRTVARLGPGETTIRTFHLGGGARTLAGQSVIVGLTEVDGPLRLNREINLPAVMLRDGLTGGAISREMGRDGGR